MRINVSVLAIVCAISMSAVAAGLVEQNPPTPTDQLPVLLPHERIAALQSLIDDLDPLLDKNSYRALRRPLDEARERLRAGDAAGTINAIARFERSVAKEAKRGLPTDVAKLAGDAAGVRTQIGNITSGVPRATLPQGSQGCGPLPCAIKSLTLHVVAGRTVPAPDGSLFAPFATLNDALQFAVKMKACAVELVLARGAYDESIFSTIDLTISGPAAGGALLRGSVRIAVGRTLHVARLDIEDSPSPGAIVATQGCNVVSLLDVNITRAHRHAIVQRNGALSAHRVNIVRTFAEADAFWAGAGIYLYDGAQAVIGTFSMINTGAGGIVVDGEHTRLYAFNGDIERARINRTYEDRGDIASLSDGFQRAGSGGIVVREGALAILEFIRAADNAGSGVVLKNGARTHIRYSRIASSFLPTVLAAFGTRGLDVSRRGFLDGWMGGRNTSTAEIHEFEIYDHYFGVRADGSYLTAAGGLINYAGIGMDIGFRPDDDPDFRQRDHQFCAALVDVRFERVDVALIPLPLPDGGPPLGGDDDPTPPPPPPPPGPCKTVPFVCTWCR